MNCAPHQTVRPVGRFVALLPVGLTGGGNRSSRGPAEWGQQLALPSIESGWDV